MPTNYNTTNGLTDITYNGTSLTAMFYNGVEVFSKTVATTLGLFGLSFLTRIDSNGTMVGSEINNLSTNELRASLGGASLGAIAMFYGGEFRFYTLTSYNTVTRVNIDGVRVGNDTNVGTARSGLAGAGL